MKGRDRIARRARLADEAGFTLVELLIAMLLLAIGVFALVSTIDGSRALSNVGQRLSAASDVAERTMEQYNDKQYRYSDLALTGDITSNGDAADQFVCTPNALGEPHTYRWDQTTCPGTSPYGDPLVVNGTTIAGTTVSGGVISPTPQSWFDARSGARGLIHTYITWVNDSCSDAPLTGTCAEATDYKRVTVAVTTTNGPPKKPVIITDIVADPNPSGCSACVNPYVTPGLRY
jgi:prepilin-type N-terminal cleavage/methylation domain-containing protein